MLSALIVFLLGVASLVAGLLLARKYGLTDAQKQRRIEEAATFAAVKERLGLIERKATDLQQQVDVQAARIASLEATVKDRDLTIRQQASELAELHELISDGALEALRDLVAEREREARRPRRPARPVQQP